MKDVLVSMIIPVYKVEKYINRCIDSVLCQTYKNLEIILVDDGSPDNCGKICDEYAKTDERVRVIHKRNEGVSIARNTGIKASTGEFIMFVDSDDYIPTDSVSILLSKQKRNNSDLIIGNYTAIGLKEEKTAKGYNFEYNKAQTSGNILDLLKEHVMFTPWGKLFRSKIIKENKLGFKEDIAFGEDSIFVMEYIEKANVKAFVAKSVYNYNTVNENSASLKYHNKFHEYSKIFTDIVKRMVNEKNDKLITFMNERIFYIIAHHVYNSHNLKSAVIGVHSTITMYRKDIEDGSFEVCGRKAKFLVKHNVAWALVFYLKATRLILSLIRKIKKVVR